jgi:hypothetical protein
MPDKNTPEIHFRDETIIDQPANKSILKDAKKLIESSEGAAKLSVQLDATHSGLLTNGRVYPSKHVRDGYKTYYSVDNGGAAQFNKPVLKHHDHHADPIGRIVGGQFIKLKTGEAFRKDFLTPDTVETGGKGSGVVRLTAEITDADSIQKVLDDRLISVSSGHSTDSMTCSVCGGELMDAFARMFSEDEDACRHVPGNTYEDDDGNPALCFGITGKLRYHEVSFVNIPAQQPARKVDWELIKMTDSVGDMTPIISTHRGRKSDIPSMILSDDVHELDLLHDKGRRLDGKVFVPMSVADKISSSVLGGDTSEDDAVYSAEPKQVDTPEDSGKDTNSRHGTDSDASSSGKKKDSGDATDGRQNSSSTSDRSGKSKSRLGDDSDGDKMADKKDLSEGALLASIESLTQDKENLETQITDKTTEIQSLEAKVAAKETEVSRLTDDMSNMQGTMAKDYATIVAQYRVLLNKPGTDGLDDTEAKEAYIDELAKRSVESLRDSLMDLSEEYAIFLAEQADSDNTSSEDSSDNVDVSDNKLTSPALVDADGNDDNSPATASDLVDQKLGI